MIRVICLLILFIVNVYAECTCLYFPNVSLTKNICEDFNYLIKCKMKKLSLDNFRKTDTNIIIIAGFGTYKGLFMTNNFSDPDHNLLLWSEIANKKADMIIIDSCFSGYVFDYNPKANFIITSTGREQSWNIIDAYGRNTSSFAAILRCFFDKKDYKCPIDISTCKTLNKCQLKLIFEQYKTFYTESIFNDMYDWEYPSIGTMLFNNKIKTFK